MGIDCVSVPVQNGYGAILVAVDHHTKLLHARPLRNKTAQTIVDNLEEIVGSAPAKVRTIISDNGPEFINALFHKFTEELYFEEKLEK